MISRLIRAFKKVAQEDKAKKSETDLAYELLSDPLNLELIAKIAKKYDRCFEIIRPNDGVVLRFYENGFEPVRPDASKDVW